MTWKIRGLALFVCGVLGCAGAQGLSGGFESLAPTSAPAAEASARDAEVSPAGAGRGGQSRAGLLTAGAWDDNRNFEDFLKYRQQVLPNLQGALSFDEQEHVHAQHLAQDRRPRTRLDVALVIDTTGSMGDEIRYLQTEFDALSRTIERRYPRSEQRWALVAYRDQGDAYVVRDRDFDPDPVRFRRALGSLDANGGGDFPEAPDAALAAMNQLSWRAYDGVARLAFWVADAPHHADRAGAMTRAVRVAQRSDVHVYPVASSGIDELTELSMRSTAQITLGRYLFLTDDSGVGNAHKEPTIPCYFVTQLDHAILRMVDIELSGRYVEPRAEDIVRTSGTPRAGRCSAGPGPMQTL